MQIATVKTALETHQSFQLTMPDEVWRFLPLDGQGNGASLSSFHQAPQLSSLKLRNLRGQVLLGQEATCMNSMQTIGLPFANSALATALAAHIVRCGPGAETGTPSTDKRRSCGFTMLSLPLSQGPPGTTWSKRGTDGEPIRPQTLQQLHAQHGHLSAKT